MIPLVDPVASTPRHRDELADDVMGRGSCPLAAILLATAKKCSQPALRREIRRDATASHRLLDRRRRDKSRRLSARGESA